MQTFKLKSRTTSRPKPSCRLSQTHLAVFLMVLDLENQNSMLMEPNSQERGAALNVMVQLFAQLL
jgi:hypothetical protein